MCWCCRMLCWLLCLVMFGCRLVILFVCVWCLSVFIECVWMIWFLFVS